MSNLNNTYFREGELTPVIVQDVQTQNVLMLAYMNGAAMEKTLATKKVTFFSRSKQRLWTKGESSGNFLNYRSHLWDCDKDSILLQASPEGPTCHKGTATCWGQQNHASFGFLSQLEEVIEERVKQPQDDSYVVRMNQKGLDKIAQKVGEEAVEVVIASKNQDQEELIEESADLLFHLLLLLNKKKLPLQNVVGRLMERHNKKREA